MICHHSCHTVHVFATEVSEAMVVAHLLVVGQSGMHPQSSLNRRRHRHGGGNDGGDGDANGDNHGRARHLLGTTHVHVHNLEG